MGTTTLGFSKIDDILPSNFEVLGSVSADLLGLWKNTNPATGLITEVILEKVESDYLFHVFGAGRNGDLIDWGKSACVAYYSNIQSDVIEGFTSSFNLNFMDVHLCANVKYGVLVLQIYTQFKDGDNRKNYIGREFFVQNFTHDIDVKKVFPSGVWKNTNSQSKGIEGFEVTQKGSEQWIHIKGMPDGILPRDWGLANLKYYANNTEDKIPVAWFANYDSTEFSSVLSININRGLIIIAASVEFKDNSKATVFFREFYAKK